jgi:hypothetical protein
MQFRTLLSLLVNTLQVLPLALETASFSNGCSNCFSNRFVPAIASTSSCTTATTADSMRWTASSACALEFVPQKQLLLPVTRLRPLRC